jgi:cytochrome P450
MEIAMVQTMTSTINRLAEPPVAKGFPIVGAIPALLREQIDFLEHARVAYGDIYKLNLGTMSMVMLNRPEHAQHVIVDNVRNYGKGGQIWDSIRDLVGNGLATSSGDFWLRQRRMMQPQFHRQRVGVLSEVIVNHIAQHLENWSQFVGRPAPMNVYPEITRMNMAIVMSTMFGSDIPDEESANIRKKMAFVLDHLLVQAFVKPIPGWVPIPSRTQFQQTLKDIATFIYGVIEKRRKNLSDDVISMLIAALDDESGDQMTNHQLFDEVITIFSAHETTSLAMSWMMYFLAHDPIVLECLQQEVDSVLGQRLPTFEDLPRLTYSRQILQETLRLCPPSYFLPRVALEDDVIDGFRIPAGQMVAPIMYTIHRHPEFWEAPDKFNPDRFSPAQSKGRHPLAWMPFGAGQRICIGRDFAYMEGTFLLAMFIQRFNMTAPAGFVTEPRLSITLHPKKPILVHLKPR